MPTTIVQPRFKPAIDFKVEVLTDEERSTIVHCTVQVETFIRIWPTTFLIQENGERKKLLQAFNITPYPQWKYVEAGHCFTLVFEGLDKDCRSFHLLEEIPEPGGIFLPGIERNHQDVYWVDVE